MNPKNIVLALGLGVFVAAVTAQAAQKPITLGLSKALSAGHRLIAIGTDGRSKTVAISGKKLSIVPPSSSVKLYVLDSDNVVSAQIVNKFCVAKGGYANCSKKNLVNTTFKAGSNLGTAKALNGALLTSLSGAKYKKFVVSSITATATNWVPSGIASHGLASHAGPKVKGGNRYGTRAATDDGDADGLVDALDSDDDGDGTLDNYDKSSSPGPVGASSLTIFSNLKLNIDDSINLHTTGLDSAKIDSVLRNAQTLAIQVAGPEGVTTELDCGHLGYCSAGGTGKTMEGNLDFPGTPGGALDPDSNGYGTIARGNTGDFQLKTGAGSTEIGAGDTLIERYADPVSGAAVEVPGMLNFVFNSNPAVKSFSINGGAEQVVNYAAMPILGSRDNCLSAAANGEVSVTLTGYRPQRPGSSSAGEAAFVDIGGSLITFDIPNPPVVPGHPGGGQGPGNCPQSSYSTSDANLSTNPNGLSDGKADQDADASNTYTFMVNVSGCLTNGQHGPISWNAGETLYLDLQFRSSRGDNAAQKFCVTRAAS